MQIVHITRYIKEKKKKKNFATLKLRKLKFEQNEILYWNFYLNRKIQDKIK